MKEIIFLMNIVRNSIMLIVISVSGSELRTFEQLSFPKIVNAIKLK